MSDIMVDQPLKPEKTTVGNNLQQQHKQDEEQQPQQSVRRENAEYEDEELHRLLVPDITQLPLTPPSAVESNFVSYFAPDCVIGLASTHLAFKEKGGIMAVDFNVGKSNRSGMKVTGKRKKNAQHFESNTALCKVCTDDDSYIVRWGSLLEVNERLIKQPELLNLSADKEGYIAIVMPKPSDWLKASLLSLEEFKKLRALC
ncbi:Single hybrid motif superfamily protein isoform 2 [Hibiscus syriacus]|uniref:Single hybrid motif superfamily protein isoform 2 n=1 Tax=Hibiscus syriacus TaxID=106335 RepID=A0A6A2ZEN1_HIBSY|nr:Single hybrid motif superfamily protein isoform 2 [Hibiscus syriacus]